MSTRGVNEKTENSVSEQTEKVDHTIIRLVKKLAFPTLVLAFCLMYLNSTWNRLELSTLVYPYAILLLTLALVAVIYAKEIFDTLSKPTATLSISESVKRLLSEWDVSILVVVTAIGYIAIMETVGFFPASFLAIVTIMYIGGVQNWRLIGVVSIATLIAVYILFVVVLGIRPPSGYVQIEFTVPW
ncbi:tripartite tricarboxylate transporter TctB family protein [Halalkalicoccus sp. NIPERK01]|uniref:tripartite tricarboxylate transporter TctB family protein n=1 Tax=Halalkalicoccus sp. NIPERK01 TaxID=3053469 RepID=UPI00256F4DE0|nr:tripartite tricarboxylate transporter TctB family protein [Halalkalicoccus sp. NIPERK01]MDL5363837.1 tripartite tricarboxylate transporter TctB family protein [Halalkalicoccus sp. NIPERK01]